MSALASHNSVGAGIQVVQADEVDLENNVGELQPDIPDGSPLEQTFADHLGALARDGPDDQTGTGYSEECKPTSEIDDSATVPGSDQPLEESMLENGTACYIGYFDTQLEYVILTSFLVTRGPGDPLYPINPAADDTFCNAAGDNPKHPMTEPTVSVGNESDPLLLVSGGSDDFGDDGNIPVGSEADPIDQSLARANRTQHSDCQGSSHLWFAPPLGMLAIDTDILETATMGSDANGGDGTGAADLMPRNDSQPGGTEEGSGTLTLPFTATPYLYIFGEPHPKTPEDNRSACEAGVGPFGADPLPNGPDGCNLGGSQLADIEGACQGRTDTCRLLTPEDIKRYDPKNAEGNLTRAAKSNEQARVCSFEPQYFSLTPGTLQNQPCGPFGGQVTQFYPEQQLGGLDSAAVPSTWAHTLPGWHHAQLLLNQQSSTEWFDFNCDGGSYCHDLLEDGDQFGDGGIFYYAVNPRVPSVDGPLWCVKPNFIGSSANVPGTNLTDNGFYNYTADAMDTDLYTHFSHEPMKVVREATHDPARDTIGEVQAISPIERDEVTSAQAFTSLGNNLGDEAVEQRIRDNPDVPPGVKDAIDRADYTEGANDDPQAEFNAGDYHPNGTAKNDTTNQHAFSRTFEKGLRCDPTGVPRLFEQNTTQSGGLNFDVQISHQTFGIGTPALKDPTLNDSSGPKGEESTRSGPWNAKTYSIAGSITGVIDSNENQEFDPCTQALGQPQPSRDFCPWQPHWDAYNDECTVPDGSEDPPECGPVLEDRGYNTTEGVGIYTVINVTGPVVIYGEDVPQAQNVPPRQGEFLDRQHVLGAGQPLGQHCIIGISKGFAPKLANMIGSNTTNDDTFGTDDENALCGTPENRTGEIAVITDAFDDQGGPVGGGFSGAFEFAKLAPTPEPAHGLNIGDSDRVCVTGIWNIQDNTIAQDTNRTLNLGIQRPDGPHFSNNGDRATFWDCDPLTTE